VSANIQQTEGGQWVASCPPCGWLPDERMATDRDRAERQAAIHNSEAHTSSERPEWAEIARWADQHGVGMPA
jgi:hypothetical protein